MVERGPEKAGVGGSIPSLATIKITNLQGVKHKPPVWEAYACFG